MERITLKANKRTVTGKEANRKLRLDHYIPGIVYGKGHTPMAIAIPLKELHTLYLKGGFFARIILLEVEDMRYEVLPYALSLHPVKDIPQHVDFLRINPNEEVRVLVPIHYTNQERSIGIKNGGKLHVVMRRATLYCLPHSIPETLTINLEHCKVGQRIHLKEIALPEGVRVPPMHQDILCSITGRQKEEATPAAAA